MDPADPDNELGQIVARGIPNYDPMDILVDCENLFVDYRPGGMVAQSLRMHSAGGMHLLFCLKHNYVQGTGNLLSELYNSSGDGPVRGFKQGHCQSCTDCSPRAPGWTWSLAWQGEERLKHEAFLNKSKVGSNESQTLSAFLMKGVKKTYAHCGAKALSKPEYLYDFSVHICSGPRSSAPDARALRR